MPDCVVILKSRKHYEGVSKLNFYVQQDREIPGVPFEISFWSSFVVDVC